MLAKDNMTVGAIFVRIGSRSSTKSLRIISGFRLPLMFNLFSFC